jgi:putative transposase
MRIRFVFLLMTRFASWLRLSRREEAWKIAEILILRYQLAVLQRQPRRPKLNWADRAMLAALLSVIPKARRHGLRLLVTPKRFCAGTATSSAAAGRPGPRAAGPAGQPSAGLSGPWVLRLARENPNGDTAGSTGTGRPWESRSREILKTTGIDSRRGGPGRGRTGPSWSQFLRSQTEAILACDFFSVELLDGTQPYVLAVIEHVTRRIRIPGLTLHPTGTWTAEQARNLLMASHGQAGPAERFATVIAPLPS